MGVQRGGRAIKEGGRDLGVRVGQEIPGGDCGAVAAPRGGGGDGADGGTELSAKGEGARAVRALSGREAERSLCGPGPAEERVEAGRRGGGGPLASGLGEGREWTGPRWIGLVLG